ncbi:MAG: CPXCG motif-containing cysteine-rich protein, partial [Gammaproteobacteria bacterium]
MSEALHSHQACCPYCGAAIELLVDLSGGSQQYVEDCSTC